MNQNSILFGMVNGPVGLGVDKVSQWIDHSELTDSTHDGKITMSQQIPAGSFLLGTQLTVEEIFDGDTNTLDVGTTDAGAEIAAALAVSVATKVGTPAVTPLQYIAADQSVYVEVNEGTGWANVTTGRVLVEVYYLTNHLELSKGYPNKFHS